jgi:hypothetical protein
MQLQTICVKHPLSSAQLSFFDAMNSTNLLLLEKMTNLEFGCYEITRAMSEDWKLKTIP